MKKPRKGLSGDKNPNWRGGRSITDHGYVLIRVGVGHPNADVRGYAYEHRLVAEKMLGRPLLDTEIVHHRNGIKKDNRPANLEVVTSIAEHRERHRQWVGRLKKVNQPNPVISCKCGCGTQFNKYDNANRPREYVSGHNPIASPTVDAILSALKEGPLPRTEIAARLDKPTQLIATTLSRMKNGGLVTPCSKGVWCLPKDFIASPVRDNPTIRCACGCGKELKQFDAHWRARKYISGHNARRK